MAEVEDISIYFVEPDPTPAPRVPGAIGRLDLGDFPYEYLYFAKGKLVYKKTTIANAIFLPAEEFPLPILPMAYSHMGIGGLGLGGAANVSLGSMYAARAVATSMNISGKAISTFTTGKIRRLILQEDEEFLELDLI